VGVETASFHRADDLVPEDERELRPGELTVGDVEIGAAHAAGEDLEPDLARPGLRSGNGGRAQRAARGVEDHRSHPFKLPSSSLQSSRATLQEGIDASATTGGSMKVADIMQTTLETIGTDDSVAEAVTTIAEQHVSGLPVVNDRGRLVGVISSTDVLQLLSEVTDPERRGDILEATLVREIMTAKPVTVEPDADVHEAARQMLYGEIHRLFVEYDGALVGVLSQTDIVGAVAGAKL
jgi:CBS domain-containing protein